MGPEDTINGTVEVVSFNDTLEEIERLVREDLSEDQTIPVNSIDMYEVIAELR